MSLDIKTPVVLNTTATGEFGAISIKAMHDSRLEKYTTVSIGIENPMAAVTPTGIRRIRLGSIRSDALRKQLMEANPDLLDAPAIKSYFAGTNGRAAAKKTHLSPSAEQLEVAATIFKLARLVGDYPIKAVQRCFGLEHAVARFWVNRARSQGVLV